ncbi:UPF0102 protein [Arenicella chitinivorans]|uniref:UPF0102 protein GCM10008090_14240 n=1 Tax=Arenicella chitinivorans TaxID=1329800 RepID=A0A918VKD3_9GAMM|nr:YraN family protein [Arenicella chitinivorans]GHA05765.1 UPF0102 protein [Arenicella chitinivorans]
MIRIGTRATGNHAEDLAVRYLRKRRLTLVERNYFCKVGELDLIMMHFDYLVFVEVRHRRDNHFGGALESVDQFKQAKLRRAAEHYLQATKNTDCPCRFDILCVNGNLNQPEFEWIRNAF